MYFVFIKRYHCVILYLYSGQVHGHCLQMLVCRCNFLVLLNFPLLILLALYFPFNLSSDLRQSTQDQFRFPSCNMIHLFSLPLQCRVLINDFYLFILFNSFSLFIPSTHIFLSTLNMCIAFLK